MICCVSISMVKVVGIIDDVIMFMQAMMPPCIIATTYLQADSLEIQFLCRNTWLLKVLSWQGLFPL